MDFFSSGMKENKDVIAAGMAVDIVGKLLSTSVSERKLIL